MRNTNINTKEKATEFLEEALAIFEQQKAFRSKYHNYNNDICLLDVETEHNLHIYKGIEKLARLMDIQLEYCEEREMQYFMYKGMKVFELN